MKRILMISLAILVPWSVDGASGIGFLRPSLPPDVKEVVDREHFILKDGLRRTDGGHLISWATVSTRGYEGKGDAEISAIYEAREVAEFQLVGYFCERRFISNSEMRSCHIDARLNLRYTDAMVYVNEEDERIIVALFMTPNEIEIAERTTRKKREGSSPDPDELFPNQTKPTPTATPSRRVETPASPSPSSAQDRPVFTDEIEVRPARPRRSQKARNPPG